MKALTPREIIEKIDQNKECFLGTKLTISSSSGIGYSGELLGMTQHRDGVTAVLKSSHSGDYQWVSLNYLESVSIPAITDEQRAILSDLSFDPLAGKPEPGKLALARTSQEYEARINQAVGKPIKLIFADSAMAAAGAERALQVNTLQSVMGLVVSIIDKNFKEDFAKDALCKVVDVIELRPSEKGLASIKGQTLEIHCPWSEPKERWTEPSLKDALNDCF
jgi:hypothetical protein